MRVYICMCARSPGNFRFFHWICPLGVSDLHSSFSTSIAICLMIWPPVCWSLWRIHSNLFLCFLDTPLNHAIRFPYQQGYYSLKGNGIWAFGGSVVSWKIESDISPDSEPVVHPLQGCVVHYSLPTVHWLCPYIFLLNSFDPFLRFGFLFVYFTIWVNKSATILLNVSAIKIPWDSTGELLHWLLHWGVRLLWS